MAYSDLREFIRALEKNKELKRIPFAVDPRLEITEFADRSVKNGGPALLFERHARRRPAHTRHAGQDTAAARPAPPRPRCRWTRPNGRFHRYRRRSCNDVFSARARGDGCR